MPLTLICNLLPTLRRVRAQLALTILAALVAAGCTARAEGTSAGPAAPAVLTVEGDLGPGIGSLKPDGQRVLRLDMATLKALPVHHVATTTVWTAGRQTFTGVLLRDLLEQLGVAHDATLHAAAANAYAIDIPASDATDPGPIIAYARNGAPMPLRDGGPLWLVYPYDAGHRWQTQVIYSHSVWQLVHITIIGHGGTH